MAAVRRVGPTRLLLRVEEAAERLGIARTSMFQLIATRQVDSVTVGRLRRIPVAALEEYVERLLEAQREDQGEARHSDASIGALDTAGSGG